MSKNWGSKLFEKIKDFATTNVGKIVISLVVVSVIVLSVTLYKRKDYYDDELFQFDFDPEKPYSETTCVCVFDLDGTLTCGLDRAHAAVEECRKRNCKFAINTARPVPNYSDIKLDKIGLSKTDIQNDVYHGEWVEHMVSTISYEGLGKRIAENKVDHLNTIRKKYGVDKKRIILFDDVYQNIKEAKANGFGTVHANHPRCGLRETIRSEISDILDH